MKRKVSLIFLLLIGLGIGSWLALRPKLAPAPVLLHPSSRQLAQAEAHLNGLKQAASGLDTSTHPGPRTLRLSENDLNVYLAGSRSARKLLASRGVLAVQIILLEPANVVLYATVRISKHPQNIEIDGSLAPDPKTGLRFTASSAKVGRFPLPAAFVTAQANALAAKFSRQFERSLSISVQGVSVQKKELVIVGLPVIKAQAIKAFPRLKSPVRH